jgi:peptidoglycan/xylan/chitin deacetylase (PgdA/CDA1 family)
MIKRQKIKVRFVALQLLIAACLALSAPLQAHAAANLGPAAKVSFTFDDGYSSSYTKAAPALAQSGYTGTAYVTTDFVGLDEYYLTWQQMTKLKNDYGWEIGAHSVTHADLTEINATQLESELANGKQTLANHGFDAVSFATPYGSYNNQVMAGVAKHYSSHRPFWDQQYSNDWAYNNYLLYVRQVQVGVSVDQVKAYIDEAKQNNAWLVLVFHDIADSPSQNPQDYEYATADLAQIAAYAQSQGLANTNIKDGFPTNTNLVSNSSFDGGLSDWSTDVPANAVLNTAGRGSYPSPTNSVEITSPVSGNAHLFSPKVAVDSSKTYLAKTFLNLESISGGEVFFYMDEYDADGNWISGQYKVGAGEAFVEMISFSYQPSSANVKQASLQIGATGGSGIRAFVDNVVLFSTN